MKTYRLKKTNGIEITQPDFDVVASLAARSMDFVCSELFRLAPNEGIGTAPKGIIPYSIFGSNSVDPQSAGVVTTNGSTDRIVRVYPFRALVSALSPVSALPETGWENVQTVDVVQPDTNAGFLHSLLQLDATSSDKRIDLIYVKVKINTLTASEIRYVRDPITGVVSQPTVAAEISNTFELLIAKGTGTGGTPTRPALPADDTVNGFFYIPLAYVYLPTTFVAATAVDNHWIHEVSPVVPLARATSAVTMRPANNQYATSGALITNQPFGNGGGDERPQAYMPPTMTGGEHIMLAFDFDAGTPYPPLNTTTVVDSSVDWRNRVFRWQASEKHTGGVTIFAWGGSGGDCPGVGSFLESGTGQSFWDDGTGFMGTAGGVIAALGSGGGSPMASTVYLYVDMSTGNLKAKVSNVSPAARVFVWLEASGQMANA